MLSSRRLIVPLFVYLSLLLATAVEAHDVPLHLRDHSRRLMKKRSPLPQANDSVPPAVVGAGIIPTLSATTTSTSTTTSSSGTVSSSSTTTSGTSTTTSTSTGTGTTTSGTSTSTSTTSTTTSTSSTSTSTTSTSTSTAAHETTPALNLTDAPVPSTSTVVPTITRIASVDQANETPASTLSAAAATSNQDKGATATILIAVAASIGGIFILWTVFRKWKLASSKKFDQRLQPINWQQPTDEDSGIPTHRRANSRASSFRSGSGHSHSGASSRADPLDHDFTAGSSTVGGYADLARGPSPLPPMQEHLTRGPSFNRGFDNGVPLHHQGFGARDAYDYNGGAPRY